MKKAIWSAVAVVAAVVMWSAPAAAQTTSNGSVNVTAVVNARAKLTLGAASVSFADADPDVSPTLSATPLSVDVKARTSASGNVTLTVLAGGDLTSGTDTIGIGNLSWTGTNGISSGTASSATAQSAGSWTGSGTYASTQTYALVNSWAYAPGTYSVTLNYTLTAP